MQGRTVGASALVWQDGREVCFDSAGLASREGDRPFARDTLVQIFSMTKPVTGTALMQLWEQGKFGLRRSAVLAPSRIPGPEGRNPDRQRRQAGAARSVAPADDPRRDAPYGGLHLWRVG